MFQLVCFDIVDDRTRARAVKILKEYGIRVQKSVFECGRITEEQFVKMRNRLEECIDSTEDTVRFYSLCRGCIKNVEFCGLGQPPGNEAYGIV